MKLKPILATLAVLCGTMAWGWSQDGEAPFGKLERGLETPHIKFASPRGGKPLKILVSAFGIGQREVLELEQRFSFTPVLLPVQDLHHFSPWSDGKKKDLYAQSMSPQEYQQAVEDILAHLPECDAILIGKTSYDLIPETVRMRMLERVRQGAGLLWIAPVDKKMDIPGVELTKADTPFFPVQLVPSLKGLTCYRGQLGKGKVMEVVYRMPKNELIHQFYKDIPLRTYLEPLTPFESDHPLYYDCALAFLGKCIWEVTVPERGVTIRTAEGNRIGLSTVPSSSHQLEVSVFNHQGEILFRQRKSASKEMNCGIPGNLSNSSALVLYRLLDADGLVWDFQIGPWQGRHDNRLMGIDWPRDGWKPGEVITGSIRLAKPAPRGQLKLSLTDEYGWVIHRQTIRSPLAEQPVVIRLQHQRSRFAQVRVDLEQGGLLQDQAFSALYINTIDQDRKDFCFSIWSNHAVNSRISRLTLQRMKEAGVDNVMECTMGGTSYKRKCQMPRWIKEAGMNFSVYISYVRGPSPKAAHGKDCQTMGEYQKYLRTGQFPRENPKYFKNATRLMDIADGAKHLGVYFYNLGDENALTSDLKKENCFCDECQKRFRTYLQQMYGTLTAVNREYGRNYKTWDEIRAVPFMDACRQGLTSLWVDFRGFMEDQFIGQHLFRKAQITAIDPDAICGIEGMAPPADSVTGFNFVKMLPHFRFCAPYFTSRECHAMKFLAPDAVRAAWFGTYEGQMRSAVVRRTPWRYLFHGLNGAFWWAALFSQGNPGFSNAAIFRPDLRFLRQFTEAAQEIGKIKSSGIGMLMNHAVPHADGVAIHYSNACLHASMINPGMTNWGLSHEEFGTALENAAISYEFLSQPELEQGVPSRVKVLVMPFSQALSDRECVALRRFVERGGLLIADYLPGALNEHGTVRKRNLVADLFTSEKMRLKKTGRGYAVLVEDYFRGIAARVGMGSAGGLAGGLHRLLECVGVQPVVKVTDEFESLQRADVYQNGDLTLVGMLGPVTETAGKAKNAGLEAGQKTIEALGGSPIRTLLLERPLHAYDMGKGGAYLGYAKQFKVCLEPIVGRVLVLTEKAQQPLQVEISPAVVHPGEAVSLRLGQARGCSIMSVYSPTGAKIYEQRISGAVARYVPAWNHVPGRYRVCVRPVLGGSVSDVSFTLQQQ